MDQHPPSLPALGCDALGPQWTGPAFGPVELEDLQAVYPLNPGKVDSLAALPIWRWRFAVLALATLPCLALVYVRNPEEQGFYPPCLFYALTGLHCPGCGTLRGLNQLLHGNMLAAIGYNPFTMLALPVIGYAFLWALLSTTWGKRLPTVYVHPALMWGLLVSVVAFWVLRNLPVYPFTVLAP